MQLVFLDDYPSQQYTLAIGDANYDVLFMYNQIADRWSVSFWAQDSDCPLIAGRFIEAGRDLTVGLFQANAPLEDMLIAIDRPGVSSSGLNWYRRLTQNLSDGLPATLLVLADKDELAELLKPQRKIAC
jgi:hypothetical protein